MLNFKVFLSEENQKANKHLEHLEDGLLNDGFNGLRDSIKYLSHLQKQMSGKSTKKVNLTTKWDGAPAIIAGTDPETKKFFVATKHGATAKSMKLNFSYDDIEKNHPDLGLQNIMKSCLDNLRNIKMKNIYQGDLLYSSESDKKIKVIDGVRYLTFKPNTITYAIDVNSDLGKKMMKSRIGVIWHTKYSGNVPVNQMGASFHVDLEDFTENSSVWFKDAEYENMDGIINFTKTETDQFYNLLSGAGRLFRKLDKSVVDKIFNDDKIKIQIKAYQNSKVREGKMISDDEAYVSGLLKYLKQKLDKELEKLKSEKGRENKKIKNDEFLKFFVDNKSKISDIFKIQQILVAAKMLLMKKLQDIRPLVNTFIEIDGDFKVTNPEGFVATSLDKGAVKLVDRLEFSRQNFAAVKTFGKG